MEHDCGFWVSKLSHRVKKRMNAALANLGITGVQSRILHFILDHRSCGPVFQRDLEVAFGMSRSTATGTLNLMEKSGLIRRESVPDDARLKSLVPTEKAVLMDAQVRAFIREIELVMMDGISEEQRRIFLETAVRMYDNLDDQQKASKPDTGLNEKERRERA